MLPFYYDILASWFQIARDVRKGKIQLCLPHLNSYQLLRYSRCPMCLCRPLEHILRVLKHNPQPIKRKLVWNLGFILHFTPLKNTITIRLRYQCTFSGPQYSQFRRNCLYTTHLFCNPRNITVSTNLFSCVWRRNKKKGISIIKSTSRYKKYMQWILVTMTSLVFPKRLTASANML